MKKSSKNLKSPPPAVPAAAPKIVAAPRVLKPVALARAAAPAAPAAAATVITARIDVGFGNTLFLRGSGPGLSWDKGVPLDCVGGAQWTISLRGAARPVVFKFLLNDERWSAGADYIAAPGLQVTFTPSF